MEPDKTNNLYLAEIIISKCKNGSCGLIKKTYELVYAESEDLAIEKVKYKYKEYYINNLTIKEPIK
jgi:hypothetical protein